MCGGFCGGKSGAVLFGPHGRDLGINISLRDAGLGRLLLKLLKCEHCFCRTNAAKRELEITVYERQYQSRRPLRAMTASPPEVRPSNTVSGSADSSPSVKKRMALILEEILHRRHNAHALNVGRIAVAVGDGKLALVSEYPHVRAVQVKLQLVPVRA